MADAFILRLPRLAALPDASMTPVSWLRIDAHGVVTGPIGRGTLADAAIAAEGLSVRVLVPGTDVFLTAPTLPVRGAAKLLPLVPFALEDQLASDVDLLHFAVGRQRADQSLPVAVVDRSRLSACLASLQAVGIRPISLQSEASAVPANPAHTVIVIDAGCLMCRPAEGLAVTLDATPLQPALELVGLLPVGPEGSEALVSPVHGLLYVSADDWPSHQDAIEKLRGRLSSLNVQVMPEGVLPVLAAGTSSLEAINVLQGAYAPSARLTDHLVDYHWAGVAAAILLLLHGVSLGTGFWRHHQQERALDDSLRAVITTALPNSHALVQPSTARLSIEARIRVMHAAVNAGLIGALSIVADGFKGGDSTVETASYQDGRTTLTIDVPNSQVLEQLRSAASAHGWVAELQGSTPHDSRSRARVLIKEPGQ